MEGALLVGGHLSAMTPSERLFSASGLLTEGKMASISPENLEKRVLARVNIMKPGDQ